MANKKSYICRKCGTIIDTKRSGMECCGSEMMLTDDAENIEICTSPFTAEQTRLTDDGDPCDDGRGGNL
ncbi:MAG: hypothetical protein DRO67_10525 [Candidatus Asgardarchaeum californiense]|nr:MAG: hypothetical protein DRO67_10525 [Candidatus Asgardarchaeum californiense]